MLFSVVVVQPWPFAPFRDEVYVVGSLAILMMILMGGLIWLTVVLREQKQCEEETRTRGREVGAKHVGETPGMDPICPPTTTELL